MDQRLEQTLIETVTTDHPQVILSSLDPQDVYDATTEVANAQASEIPGGFYTTMIQTPLFPDLVGGFCQRLWDNQVKWGSGDPFESFLLTEGQEPDSEELAEICGNIVVQQALGKLIPVSRRRKEVLSLLIDAYCAGEGCTLEELRTLGLSRSLSRQDQLDLLIVLLRETTWPRRENILRIEEEPPLFPRPRLILHIDRVQYVTHNSPFDVARYTAALIYLLENLGDGFTLWLNIDDDDPSFPEEVRRSLGPRFMAYVTHDLTRE